MDGKPFRYVSGSFHYFRALPETWQRHLKTMRAAGLNAIDTYVEWSFHNPTDGKYTFEGNADLERFIQLAQQEDLFVILRPGPYICAERDNVRFLLALALNKLYDFFCIYRVAFHTGCSESIPISNFEQAMRIIKEKCLSGMRR